MKTSRWSVLFALGLLAVGCGGGSDGGPAGPGGGGGGGGGGNSFTATIDGVAWKSDASLIQVTGDASPTRQGTLIISGYQVSSMRGVTLDLGFIIGPATQPLGVNPASNPGGTGSVIVTPDIWMSPFSGKAGFVTITARTDKRVAGTFHFVSEPLVPGTLPATRTVEDGTFDITVASGLPALPTGVGSTSTANLGGTPWNGATIVGLHPGPGVFGLGVTTTEYSVNLTPVVPVSVGTWDIPTQVTIQISKIGTTDAWAAVGGASIGSIIITQFDANRLVATYNANVPRQGGGASLNVTSGTVNAYLQ